MASVKVAFPSASTCGLFGGAGTSAVGADDCCTGRAGAVACWAAQVSALSNSVIKTYRETVDPASVPNDFGSTDRDILLLMTSKSPRPKVYSVAPKIPLRVAMALTQSQN